MVNQLNNEIIDKVDEIIKKIESSELYLKYQLLKDEIGTNKELVMLINEIKVLQKDYELPVNNKVLNNIINMIKNDRPNSEIDLYGNFIAQKSYNKFSIKLKKESNDDKTYVNGYRGFVTHPTQEEQPSFGVSIQTSLNKLKNRSDDAPINPPMDPHFT